MGYGFHWAWSELGLVFMGLGWAELRILEPMTNTDEEVVYRWFRSRNSIPSKALD